MKKSGFLSLAICITALFHNLCFAKTPEELTKCICEEKTGQPVCLNELKEPYFKDNKYSELVEMLGKLCPENKAIEPAVKYAIALTRYNQLKYLEEAKSWDEYFARGNDYRDELVQSAQKAISLTTAKDKLNIDSGLLLYQFHKDQSDAFSESSLNDLMSALAEFSRSNNDPATIKEVADKLALYNEKGKSKELYKIYAQQLTGSGAGDAELKKTADGFYNEGNLELAANIYDAYIERISKTPAKEKLLAELIDLAKKFSYKDGSHSGPFYAEKIFKKIEGIGGKKAFDESLMYLRGFNLEKIKAFSQAREIYVEFLKTFPASKYADELTYKTGIIFVYVARDIKSGRAYLEQLAQKPAVSFYTLAALYQLGLLKQWEEAIPEAREYYNLVLAKAGDTDPDRLTLAQERLKEIEQSKPLEYNIKIGLDTALKDEFANLDMSKLNLASNFYLPEKGEEISISSAPSLGPTGCLQVELQYLWSGDLGSAQPLAGQSGFQTSYETAGTKLIAMVLISPEGITERGIDLIDAR